MIVLIILFLLTKATCLSYDNDVGSVLFYNRNAEDCWNQDDLSKLQARQIFENIMLPSFPPDKVNAKFYKDTIKYFNNAMRLVEPIKDPHSKMILQEALADTIGGHMTKEILPNARFAYYAGHIPYSSVKELQNFYDSVKLILNTQGFGWKRPNRIPLQSNLTVGKIHIGAGKPFDPCSSLIIKRNNRNCIQIHTPLVDNEAHPAAVSLPFKYGGLVSLTSPSSENILLKYYTTAARCILRRSPEECRHGDFVNFNNELWHWMKRYVAPHLMDENLYAGYGGVLRIAAAVQNYGKGLSRRNLYEQDIDHFDQGSTSWGSTSFFNKKLTFNVNTSSPFSCAYLVLFVAAMICFLHVCYTWICGPAGGCYCRARRPTIQVHKEFVMNYANVDSNAPAMLPPQSVNKCSTKNSKRRPFDKQSRSASVGTIRIQKVHDLNENTEKVMSVVMSDEELSETETTSTDDEVPFSQTAGPIRRSPAPQQRSPRSPPKIEATVAQLKIERTPQKTPRLDNNTTPLYTTSTVTQSEMCRFVQRSESASSESYTSSENSGSSLSINSETPKSTRGGQNRALAKKGTTSKQNIKSSSVDSTTITEFDRSTIAPSPNNRK